MINRYLSAVLTALAITISLVWVMHTLIEVSEAALVPVEPREPFVIGPTVIATPLITITERPTPPQPPETPPPLIPPTSSNGPTTPVLYHAPGPTPLPSFHGPDFFGQGSTALINIINAQPDYPIVASEKELEGYVVVQFDVTETGTIENAVVIESSSSVFNKPAIKAAYRSRYKPRSIDGVPQRSPGLRKMFRFEMEK